ncbi:MAG: hypothetical protein VKL59_16590 [Nostocaceae cyanobacterium]|nr:hypothetical protein [Nostocaceae cyanobacterium]
MKSFWCSTVAIIAGLTLPTAADAAMMNGSFENGFTNWQTLGETSISSGQAFLSTAFEEVISVDSRGNEIRGGNAAPFSFISGIGEQSSLEGFLGLSSFLGDDNFTDAIEGSAIRQTFNGRAGQTLSFDWNFFTNEMVGDNADPNFNDFAFATLNFNSQNLFFRLADTTSQFFTGNSSADFDETTGFQKFSFTLPFDGEYTLGLGVVDVGESTIISGLVVDNVQAVPEASTTIGLLFLGSLGAVSVLKRSQKNLPET